jgi:hypothetical protein
MKCCGFLLAAYVCISSSAGMLPFGSPDDEQVREVLAGLMRAWNVHDMHAFAEQFTDDASFVNVNGSWLRNAAQIEESHRVVHATISKRVEPLSRLSRFGSRSPTWRLRIEQFPTGHGH